MTTRDHAPIGAPCWTDLFTSDVEGSRRFYGELFGWETLEPSEEFGGYFMFARDGMPTAGGMGDMGDIKANDTWKIYLQTDDITKTVASAEAAGAQLFGPAMPVADLGIQAVMADP
ncbi:MAG TPA: VOC family protein, partial [Acidimicrobiales bacterium]|nr:VOC family protein [Acidimicrobiales bacterium]